jgi:hypothetical protein
MCNDRTQTSHYRNPLRKRQLRRCVRLASRRMITVLVTNDGVL